MFLRKKPVTTKKKKHNLSHFGFTDITGNIDPSSGFDCDDANNSVLEAEFAIITGEGSSAKQTPKLSVAPAFELDKMIAERDISSDDDDDVENDTELLCELQGIVCKEVVKENKEDCEAKTKSTEPDSKLGIFVPTTDNSTVEILKHRIEMYKEAVVNAKGGSEDSKIRRFERGLNTLYNLLKQVNSGKPINPDDIPPQVVVKPAASSNTKVSNDYDTTNNDIPKISIRQSLLPPKLKETDPKGEATPAPPQVKSLVKKMRSRQQEYKSAALQSKRAGDTDMALQFLKVFKQFDVVVKMCEDGQEVDLSDMPPLPDRFKEFMEKMQAASVKLQADQTQPDLPVNESVTSEQPNVAKTTNMLEALEERLSKYKSVEDSAKIEGNASKVRRFGRIVKQYEDAIKAYINGRSVAYDELPVPPGFGLLPVEKAESPNLPKVESQPSNPSTICTAASTPDAAPSNLSSNPSKHVDLTMRTFGNQLKNNLVEQQMKILLDRQMEFKLAALEAKKAGEITQAKEYLKIYKGFDALLNAASSGLPVDLSTLPLPPSQRENLEASFAIITTDESNPDDDISDVGVRIEEQLATQLMMCKNTRDHHKAMGDIAGMNRFENLALAVQKDLDLVRYSKRKNFPLPKFHYDKRSFNIVHCNTDLADNELEIIIVRGINYNVPNPKQVDTYVKIEFPLPNDETFKTKINLVKDTDSPNYDQHFKVDIMRDNRQFKRIFKRHGVRFEVFSRGGFLRSDTLIGTVNVKLQPLETKCDIHDTFDLMEGRKKVGGKLELKLRVRNPILTKEMEHINEKWLIIDT